MRWPCHQPTSQLMAAHAKHGNEPASTTLQCHLRQVKFSVRTESQSRWRVQVDQLVFRHLVDAGFPRLAGHLEALGAGVAGVSTQWFLCLFVNSLPLETCLRVWDLFFFERCSSVLFRVALALVDIYAQANPLSHAVRELDGFQHGAASLALPVCRCPDRAPPG